MDQQPTPTILLSVMEDMQVSELEDSVIQSLITPSPRSEMVAHELQELTLQTNPRLPPLNERKNGEYYTGPTNYHYLHLEGAI